MESKLTCPECHLIFEAELPATGVLVCPLCNSAFAALLPAALAPTPTPSPSADSGRQVLRGAAAVGAVLFLAAGMGYAYYLLSGIDHKAVTVPAPATHAPAEAPSLPAIEYGPVIPNEPIPPVVIPRPPVESLPPVRIHRRPRPLKLPPSALINTPQEILTLPK
jgi:hypothetical protein